ncbi:uncharacterized protein BDR25DRAFT_309407 [Lindgomyces ingoldianus]|uniref:Uncharacterized protein n=1 Tax=Lindgomyces ingoldianus TaxID=673940 RepID=A0ACB6RDC4_9PLEO|nr:uncharacterized protein BDR25DRAFT_309407 [Lindgomyces ingoldianus]KAF2477107.1 hypothetical protein BDR25DRAFT_309407 [Lindgomyces ingoldianus]
MLQDDRLSFADNGRVCVYVGRVPLISSLLPKESLMIVSDYARVYFTQHPTAESLNLSKILVSEAAILSITSCILDACCNHSPFTLPRGETFLETVLIYQAARALGMDRYIHRVYQALNSDIESKGHMLPYDWIRVILRGPKVDPLYSDCVRVFASARRESTLPNVKLFDNFVSAYPEFVAAMALEEIFEGRRVDIERRTRHDSLVAVEGSEDAEEAKLSSSREDNQNKRQKKGQVEQWKACFAKQQSLKAIPLKGLREKKKEARIAWNRANGVITVSAEEFEEMKKSFGRV